MQTGKSIVALATLFLLCANKVPASAEEQLAALSDLIIEARVVAMDVVPPAATPDRRGNGEFVVGSLASRSCVEVLTERHFKGAAENALIVCRNRIAELNPEPQQLGRRYMMFLRRVGSVYVAVSWDGVQQLSPI